MINSPLRLRSAAMFPVVVITALLSTTPPLVQAPEAEVPLVSAPADDPPVPRSSRLPPRVRVPLPPPAPLPPARFGLFFAPLSLFSLTFWAEGDLALVGGLDVFANVGGGPLGQFGFDVGLRYYVLGTPLEGFYLEARGSCFSLPGSGLWMLGPGFQLGHGWRIKRLTLSIALGFTTWYGARRATGAGLFFGGPVTDDEVIVFPGVTQPPQDRAGIQPAMRVSLGPWF